MNYNFKCNVCRDKGREGGCPNCHKLPQLDVRTIINSEPTETLNLLGVPQHYLSNPWSSSILMNDHDEYIDDPEFRRYIQQLDMVYNHVKSGGIIKNSALLCSPIGFGKTTWVYNCMIELIKHGYSVPPLITTSKLKAMHTVAYERPTWANKWQGFSYNDFMESDILFISVTKSLEYVYAARLILEVVDARARLSKPTVIISDWSSGTLLKTEETGMLLALLRGGTKVDPYKYLVKIEFIDYQNTNK